MVDIHYGYLSREYADRHLGAFRISKPPKFEKVQLSVDQGNHCFALIGKRAEIMKWLDEAHPTMPIEVIEMFPLAQAVGKETHEQTDGRAREGEPMPLDRNEIDAIPLSGESILIRTGSTMAQVAAKLRIKRRIMDEAGGIKVMGVRMEHASTFSSVHNPSPRGLGHGLSRHFSSVSTTSGHNAFSKKRRLSSFLSQSL
ncbi:hypothetical protein BG006_003655 [Podila minutissima]|uniref:Uncharacterized protein n=1 Tax=Podila minutissima TaxID=64525 RepID=A0A9P5SR76_9FUNG|nr:hypothetical protein BG006_003655 [Podila minutissima]